MLWNTGSEREGGEGQNLECWAELQQCQGQEAACGKKGSGRRAGEESDRTGRGMGRRLRLWSGGGGLWTKPQDREAQV